MSNRQDDALPVVGWRDPLSTTPVGLIYRKNVVDGVDLEPLVRLSDAQSAIASLQARLDAAEADAARLTSLQKRLHWDGYAYWLPDLCIKERECGEAYCSEPSLDEFRAAIDAAREQS